MQNKRDATGQNLPRFVRLPCVVNDFRWFVLQAVDYWSLGVTVFKLLTGSRPFNRRQFQAFVDDTRCRMGLDYSKYNVRLLKQAPTVPRIISPCSPANPTWYYPRDPVIHCCRVRILGSTSSAKRSSKVDMTYTTDRSRKRSPARAESCSLCVGIYGCVDLSVFRYMNYKLFTSLRFPPTRRVRKWKSTR